MIPTLIRLLASLLIFSITFTVKVAVEDYQPTVDISQSLRFENYFRGSKGSCMHASTATLLQWFNEGELAQRWVNLYGGAEYIGALEQKYQAHGIPYISTVDGDINLLQTMMDERQGAVIYYKVNHAVTLVHLDDRYAGIIDPNHPQSIEWYTREDFIAEWLARGGIAISPQLSPAPPLPFWEET